MNIIQRNEYCVIAHLNSGHGVTALSFAWLVASII